MLLRDPGPLGALDRARLVDAYACLSGGTVLGRPEPRYWRRSSPIRRTRCGRGTVRLRQPGGSAGADATIDAVLAASLASDNADVRETAIGELRAELLARAPAAPRAETLLAILANGSMTSFDRGCRQALADVAALRASRWLPWRSIS